MKIDTEGAEEAVIRGARTTIEQSHPLILCEVLSDEAGQAVADALPSGYATFKIDENRGLIPVAGPRRWEWRNKNVLLVPTNPCVGGASPE